MKSLQGNNKIYFQFVLRTWSQCAVVAAAWRRRAALCCCLLRGATEAIEYRGASHSKAGFATSVSAVSTHTATAASPLLTSMVAAAAHWRGGGGCAMVAPA